MRHIILISHGYMAEGTAGSAEMILGKREDLSYISAYVEGNDSVRKEALKQMERFEEDAEILILTDIFGGSVNNELLNLMERKNVYLISGMNLALVIGLLARADEEQDTETIIAECLEEAEKNMKFCNRELSETSEEPCLDEF